MPEAGLTTGAASGSAAASPLKIAFIGFRHSHINSLYNAAMASDALEVTGICEEHAETRSELSDTYHFTHTDYETMLDEVQADIVAIGDYFTIRGARAIVALSRGKHVVVDKPLCTSLKELDEIERLAQKSSLSVFCQLTQRDSARNKMVKSIIEQGGIGELQTVSFAGQHALNYRPGGGDGVAGDGRVGGRAPWYFENGMHGGTITDIAVHGIDLVQWITGQRVVRIVGARAWSTGRAPHIKDAAQCMLELEGGVGVMGDVSYLAPESIGQGSTPLYWRVVYHGTGGVLVSHGAPSTLILYSNDRPEPQMIDPAGEKGTSAPTTPTIKLTGQPYLDALLKEIGGAPPESLSLTTADVIATMRATLYAQHVADNVAGGVDVPWPTN